MNKILNYGFVRPFIQFQFANGQTIDTVPPRYFSSFHQTRSVKEACSFTLTLSYAPGNFDEDTATIIHGLLLQNVNTNVTYRYGYKVNNQFAPLCQNQYYAGIFTSYSEELNDGYLSYTISGVAHAVELTQPQVFVTDYIKTIEKLSKTVQPSIIVEDLVYDLRRGPSNHTGIPEYFKDYKKIIHTSDQNVKTNDIRIQDGPLHDVFFGKTNSDGSTLPGGLVSLSYCNYNLASNETISNNLLSDVKRDALEYQIRLRYNSSGITNEKLAKYKQSKEVVENVKRVPFICYYDNVIDSIGSPDKGSFYYIEKFNMQPTNIFNYNFGNSFIDSDVISFNCSYDCTPAISTNASLKNVVSDIDVDGEAISSNYNNMQTEGFVIQSYNTPSGFDNAATISATTLSNVFRYPFEASMSVIGQLECNQLMDVIRVNIFVNGVQHPTLSGDYIIQGIEDDLSMDGFTTTFNLHRYNYSISDEDVPDRVTNYSEGRAFQNQQTLINTHS